jgi:GST-like protein
MIDFYTWATSNGDRVAIMLEECGLPYRVHKVDLTKGEQRSAAYLRINPAGAIPAIVDPHGPGGQPLTLTQSGAILLHLAEKTGRFLPREPVRRAQAYQWLMFAVSDCAQATGLIFFEAVLLPDKSPANLAFAEERMLRCFRIADGRLAQDEWLAGEPSLADFALYPVCAVRKSIVDKAGDLPHLARWMAALAARPGVARGMQAAA